MTFRETLERHLRAIQGRDLATLANTVAEDELVLITAEGRVVRSPREFLERHRAWFAMPGWTLEATPLHVRETAEMGAAVLHLVYREPPDLRQESQLTLLFEQRGGRWVMTLDQNTPLKGG